MTSAKVDAIRPKAVHLLVQKHPRALYQADTLHSDRQQHSKRVLLYGTAPLPRDLAGRCMEAPSPAGEPGKHLPSS
jgi:hypothetical protein